MTPRPKRTMPIVFATLRKLDRPVAEIGSILRAARMECARMSDLGDVLEHEAADLSRRLDEAPDAIRAARRRSVVRPMARLA